MPDNNAKNAAQGVPGNSMAAIEKSRDIKKAYKDFFDYIVRYRAWIITAVILSAAGAVLNLAGPGKLSEVTDMITAGLEGKIDLAGIKNIAILLAVLYGSGFILNYLQGFIMATVTQKITRNMRHDIESKINRLPLKFFDTVPVGDTLSRVSNDVDTIGQMMNESFSTLVSSAALLAGSLVMMFMTNVLMTLAGVAAALIGVFITTYVIKRSQRYFTSQQNELGAIDSQIEEVYGGQTAVKLYGGESGEKKRFHESNSRLYDCAWKAQFMSGLMMPLMTFIGNLAYVAVCIAGAVLAADGSISFGTVVAFMLYIRLFTQPLQNLSQAATSVQSMAAACERVFEFLDEEELSDENGKKEILQKVNGDIQFANVNFGYEADRMIINDLSLSVKAGQKVAIVGPTGAGKTTLVNLLMRFYELNGGSISIDGTDTASMTRSCVHSLFGMVLQDTWLFEGTIRENILYGKNNVSQEKLDRICEAAGIMDMIKQEPQGYETVLDENAGLSVGQKQLITIARAMAEDAPLMILDEATSSVDTRTEQKVQNAMELLTQGRTSFVIAHRLSTIKNADLILVMRNGDIVESGDHESLMKKNGFYAQLYNSQFDAA